MLPESGALELMFLAAVALIVVGPKDLPVLMRKVGQWVGKMRGLAAEFRSSFDELARQSELDELRKEVEALRNGQSSTATSINSAFNEITPHIEPEGYATVETPFESAVGAPVDPHREYPAVGPGFGLEDGPSPSPAPAKPKRAPRKKVATPEAEAGAAPKPRRAAAPKATAEKTAKAPAKPRTKPAAPAESEA